MLSVGERGSGLSRATLFGFHEGREALLPPKVSASSPPKVHDATGGSKMGKQAGFTLLELIVVVLIIGVLASIAIPKFNFSRKRAFITTITSDLKNLASYQEVYFENAFVYSNSLTTLEAGQSDGVTLTINEATNSDWSATAIHPSFPGDQCGIFYGDAAQAGGSPGTVAGVIACSM